MDIFGSIALAIFCITIGWFIGHHLQVVPLRIENQALLTLLDEHLHQPVRDAMFNAEQERANRRYGDLQLVHDGFEWPEPWSIANAVLPSEYDKHVEQAMALVNRKRSDR
jgi:hypothetical protein